ncbi:MAG: hypothetical protein JWN44_2969 [Myxococcales bacterium]|nr:hypothetical protein [Myxococcales bacterium]
MSSHTERRVEWDLIALAQSSKHALPTLEQTARALAKDRVAQCSRHYAPSGRLSYCLGSAWRYLTSRSRSR